MDAITCHGCPFHHSLLVNRQKPTGRERRWHYCQHPKHKGIAGGYTGTPGRFIEVENLSTAPKWCPIKKEYRINGDHQCG